MGLDINFYAVKAKEIGSFRKVNFLLTYFEVTDEENGKDLVITKDMLEEFVVELKCELEQFKKKHSLGIKEGIEIPPSNSKFRTKEVFFGGDIHYSSEYWDNLQRIYEWAKEQLEYIDWDNCTFVMNCWW